MTDSRGAGGDNLDEFFEPNYDGRRGRGFTIFMIVVVVLVVVLAIAAVVADIAVRTYAEGRAEKEIESSLPSGTTGEVGVTIHGFSAILQALNGRLDNVTLTSHDLVVSNVPIRFTADVTNVPLKAGGTTGPVTATLSVDESALNKTTLVQDVGGNITLTKGHVTYDKSIVILGLALKARVTAAPSITSAGTKLAM
ncbi:MAG: hypothetical protein JWP75_2521, partial [Frondihabitans sp.]|nr:hypothetical protein [Frondihabitans sp.]